MKKLLPISVSVMLLFSLASCTKVVVGPGQASVTGSWILTESTRSDGYSWQYFNSGVERGVFDFYGNGIAEYNHGYTSMHGNWYTRFVSSGYYDRYGNYYSDSHQSMEIHVSDRYGGGSINLFFDDVIVTGNELIATYYDGHYIQRYIFRRY